MFKVRRKPDHLVLTEIQISLVKPKNGREECSEIFYYSLRTSVIYKVTE